MNIQERDEFLLRCLNGAAVNEALIYLVNFTDYRPADQDEYMRLVNVISGLEAVTRTWNYRGYTQQELAREGILPETNSEQIPTFETIFGEDNNEDEDEDDLIEEISAEEVGLYEKSSQARFAAETIHRIDANGKLGHICFG